MSNPRSRSIDLFSLVLGAVTLFLVISVASYHPNDPVEEPFFPFNRIYHPDPVAFPFNEPARNWCGPLGAMVGDMLLTGFGWGAYYLLVALAILTARSALQRPITAPFIRTFGWMTSLVGLTSLLSILTPGSWEGPVIGPGGYLGALVQGILHDRIATVGSLLLGGCLLMGGLLLCTDYFLFHIATMAARFAVERSRQGVRPLARSSTAAASVAPAAASSGKASAAARAAETGMSIRIGGKRVMVPADESRAVEWEIAEDEEADDESLEDESLEDGVDDDEEGEYEDEYEEDEDSEEADDEEDEEYDETGEDEAADAGARDAGRGAKRLSAGAAAAQAIRGLIQRAAPGKSGEAKASPPVIPTPAAPAAKLPAKSGAKTGEKTTEKPVAATALTTKSTGGKNQDNHERQEVIAQLEEASRHEEAREYDLPSIELLTEAEDFSTDEQEKEVRRKAKVLEKTFQDFGFRVKVVEIETGPVIAQYEIELEAGLRLSKITGLADDLAIALRVPSVRIVAPIPGKNTVGIEVPNEQRQVVRLREVMEDVNGRIKKMRIPLFLGKDVSGNSLAVDLSSLPHLLIAGRTGTGKSVCLNAIICSILMTRRPDEVRMLMIDPKMVELSGYKTLPHLMHPVVTDMRKAEAILAWAVDKMEERYALLAQVGVRHISGYNQLGEEELVERLQPETEEERAAIPVNLPYIVIVADEMADLMMTSGKEVEQHIIRLAQKSRAVGIHLILATQKPTVDVITGLIKSNLPARIAFQVASRTDSRVVLDEMGADKLLGNGDMLFLWPGTSTLLRGQGTYLSDEEINAIVECVSTGEQNFVHELVSLKSAEPGGEATPGQLKKRDDLYESAVDIVIREGRGSVSLLQRCLGIGYGRAARLIDYMAEDGIVGTYNGSQAREVVISIEDWQRMQGSGTADDPSSTPAASAASSPPAQPAAPPRKSTASAPTPAASTEAPPASTPSRRSQRVISMADWQDPDEASDGDGAFDDDGDKPAKAGGNSRSKTIPLAKARRKAAVEVLEDEDEEEEEELDGVEEEELEEDFEDESDEDEEEYDEEEEEEDEEEADEYEEESDELEEDLEEDAEGEETEEYEGEDFDVEEYEYEEEGEVAEGGAAEDEDEDEDEPEYDEADDDLEYQEPEAGDRDPRNKKQPPAGEGKSSAPKGKKGSGKNQRRA